MIDVTAFMGAIDLLTQSMMPWAVVIPGLIIGMVAGAVPGVTASMAMIILLPLTAYMDFLSAMLFLTAIFTGGGFGCAVPAILINVPGTPAAVATTFDGYPMARRGEHNEALGMALGASVGGLLVGYMLLLLLIQPMSFVVLRMGPLELFVIAIWGLTLIAVLRGRHIERGLLAGLVGVLIGTVGVNPAGYIRGTMGFSVLLDGVPVIPAMMGLFVASQLFAMIGRETYVVRDEAARVISFRRILSGMVSSFRPWGIWVRGGIIGAGVGIIPGVGSSISNLLSYSEARRRDPDPTSYGTGNPNGLIAAESANSSSEGGSMGLLLALGIPGSAGSAVLLGAFAMHNIIGGPRFITESKDVVYGIIIGNFWQGVVLLCLGIGFIYCSAAIVRIPVRYLVPSVMVLGSFGAYAYTGNVAGPAALFTFSALGYLMARYDYSIPAMVVGLVLGNMVEAELLRTYQISGADFGYLLERPFGALLIALLLVTFLGPVVLPALKRLRVSRA